MSNSLIIYNYLTGIRITPRLNVVITLHLLVLCDA